MSHKTTMEKIRGERWASLVEFNGGTHIRINGVVDVWPRKRNYRIGSSGPAVGQFNNMEQLKKIVRLAEQSKAEQVEKVVAFVASEPANKPPIDPISREEWLGRFA